MSNVNINIAAEFKGKKAFKEATTATDKLNKNVKGLAKSLIAVYSTQKLYQFTKASVKAFAEDDKAATALGTTLKNLGLAYGSNIGTVNGYINRLEMQTGVLDDELRPAMDRFLRATLSVTKSQELLNLALDISAGTGTIPNWLNKVVTAANMIITRLQGKIDKATAIDLATEMLNPAKAAASMEKALARQAKSAATGAKVKAAAKTTADVAKSSKTLATVNALAAQQQNQNALAQ